MTKKLILFLKNSQHFKVKYPLKIHVYQFNWSQWNIIICQPKKPLVFTFFLKEDHALKKTTFIFKSFVKTCNHT